MSAHTPDDHALTWRQAQVAAALDRQQRRAALCSCGAKYAPTPDGRRAHQMLHGHRPTPGGTA